MSVQDAGIVQTASAEEIVKAQVKAMYDAACLELQCYERLLEAAKQKRAVLGRVLGYREKT